VRDALLSDIAISETADIWQTVSEAVVTAMLNSLLADVHQGERNRRYVPKAVIQAI
jgi:hypothetical protein